MRGRLVPVLVVVAAVVCLVAGVVTWRMFSLHPLRAELLWAASAALALVAVGAGIRVRRGGSGRWPATTPPGAST